MATKSGARSGKRGGARRNRHASKAREVVRARAFELVDGSGEVRAELRAGPEGTSLELWGPGRKQTFRVDLKKDPEVHACARVGGHSVHFAVGGDLAIVLVDGAKGRIQMGVDDERERPNISLWKKKEGEAKCVWSAESMF